MPGYEVKFQQVGVVGGPDLEIRSLLDRQQYSDPLGEAAAVGISPATWPLFGQVWPSARKLADLMQVRELGGRRILEIGCGLALASMAMMASGMFGNIPATRSPTPTPAWRKACAACATCWRSSAQLSRRSTCPSPQNTSASPSSRRRSRFSAKFSRA